MPMRLVALDDTPDVPIDREAIVVGRHPSCEARLDSIRVSRRHCCIMQGRQAGTLVVKDLGSTNGIRINGQRVEEGVVRAGDELSIAHIRYRFETDTGDDATLAERAEDVSARFSAAAYEADPKGAEEFQAQFGSLSPDDNPLAEAVRKMMPASLADRCRIQVIVQMPSDRSGSGSHVSEDPASEPENPDRKAESGYPDEPDVGSGVSKSDSQCPPDSSPSARA